MAHERPSFLTIGLGDTSLVNYHDRLIPKLGLRSYSMSTTATATTTTTSNSVWSPLSLFHFPIKMLQHLYYSSSSSSGGSSTDALSSAASALPSYLYDPTSHKITCHPTTPSPLPLSLPLSVSALHALTVPLVERSLCLLHLLLQNRHGASTLPPSSCSTAEGGGSRRVYSNPFQQAFGLLHDAALEGSLSGSGDGGESGGPSGE